MKFRRSQRPQVWVRVGKTLLPKRVEVVFEGDAEERSPDVEMVLEVVDGRPQCREVIVRSVPGGREVRDSDLAAVRVEQLTEDAFGYYGLTHSPTQVHREVHAARRPRKMTPDFLRSVAAVYVENRSGNPTQAIEDRFGVAPRTAALYAQRATEAGFLPPTTPGRRRR